MHAMHGMELRLSLGRHLFFFVVVIARSRVS